MRAPESRPTEPGSRSGRRIRVFWTIKGLGRGGAEQLLVSLAEVADHERFSYDVCYVLPHKTALVEALEARSVTVTALARAGAWSHRWTWPWRLRGAMRDGRYDVVHAHSPLVAVAGRAVARTLPRRDRPVTVYTQHNTWQSYARASRAADLVTHRLDAQRFAVSPAVARTGPAILTRTTEPIVHGVVRRDLADDMSAVPVRDELELDPTHPLVLTVANLRATKDYPNLLAAAARVVDARRDAQFVAVGDGPLRAELEQRRDALGLGDNFRFLGTRADVPRLMRAADVFALGSRHEGLPVSVMEAMTAGLPCVLTNTGGILDVIRPDHDAVLVPTGDPEALASALLRLIDDPELGKRLATNAYLTSAAFDIRLVSRRYEQVYQEAACDSRTS